MSAVTTMEAVIRSVSTRQEASSVYAIKASMSHIMIIETVKVVLLRFNLTRLLIL